jgi:hypothetical protein
MQWPNTIKSPALFTLTIQCILIIAVKFITSLSGEVLNYSIDR